ncbi:MAG: polysaccharide deacetylase family protein [Betaproteobacteria bacterium]|nr:polysaccharide deacetylase family protein [Betaproteobacteria bacterium]
MRRPALLFALIGLPAAALACTGTVYLTLDTGHMGPAEEMAAVLRKHQIKATFFLANEKTMRGDTALDPAWAAFWKARAEEGHAFGSHTWRHGYFRQDLGQDKVRYAVGNHQESLTEQQVCQELQQSEMAFKAMTGRGFDGLWRAPGGKLTPNAKRFAEACGYRHVAWSPAGFSGDELPSERFPAATLIAQQLKTIRDGDILLWHLGIWSRKEPLYPHFEELIIGLKAKGFCFARITEHPAYRK